jgi:hypothetical protein
VENRPCANRIQLNRIREALHKLVPPDGTFGEANDLLRLRIALYEAERRGFERAVKMVNAGKVPLWSDPPVRPENP